MNIPPHRFLQAELNTLQDLLDGLPETSILERISLEGRKSQVEEELASLPDYPDDSPPIRLTFRGRPIVGSQGVRVGFGSTAVKDFANAVAIIGASQSASLQMHGALPNRDDYDLLITDVATGSFGFELQPAPPSKQSDSPSPIASAIAQTTSILEATTGTDEELTDVISETHPRALRALHGFLKTISDKEAVCSIEFQDTVFRFLDVGQVRQSERRLRQENIHEEVRTIDGCFLGALPAQRLFEFREDGTEQVFSGRIDCSLEDVSKINEVLNCPSTIRVLARNVGTASPRFFLLSYRT